MKRRYLFFTVIGLCSLLTCNLGFCSSEIHVGIYGSAGSIGIYESLKDEEGITGELIKSLSPSVLSKYNIIVLSHMKSISTRDYLRSYRDLLRRYVEAGGGIILTHNACGYRDLFRNAPLFPEIEKAVGKKDAFFMKKVAEIDHAVLRDLALKIKHGYSDHIQMEAGKKGKVLIIDEDNKAVVIAGEYGKGKVVAMGNLPGHWATKQKLKKYEGEEKKLEGEELKLLVNSIKWLSKGPLFKTVSRTELEKNLKGVKATDKRRELVFSDTFSYRHNEQPTKKWHIAGVSPGNPAWKKAGMVRNPRQKILDCPHEGYELSTKSFSKSPIKDDFIVSFKIMTILIYRNYKGRLDVCLLDEDKNGYGASISLGSTSYTNSLLKIDKGEKTVIAEAKGDKKSFLATKQGGLLDIRLSLSETGKISFKSAGKEIVTVRDTQYKEFAKLTFVVKGADSRFGIDDVKLASLIKDKSLLAEKIEKPLIVPQPKELVRNESIFTLTSNTQIVVESSDKIELYCLDELVQDIYDYFGVRLKLATYSTMSKDMPSVYVGEPHTDKHLKAMCSSVMKKVKKSVPSQEGYMLGVSDKRIVVAGASPRGTFYGLQSLYQLIAREGKQVFVRGVTVKDWPEMKIRGLHCFLRSPSYMGETREEQVPLAKRTMKAMYRVKGNFFVGATCFLPWKNYPAFGIGNTWTFEDITEIAVYAKKHFIEFVPGWVGLTHMYPQSRGPAHDKFWKWAVANWVYEGKEKPTSAMNDTICPLNPLSLKMILDMTEEYLNAVPHAKYFHTHNDEPGLMGVCPLCKGKSHAKLWATFLKKEHAFLKKKGVKMMMYADSFRGGGSKKSGKKGPAIDMIPKDIIMCPWRSSAAADYPERPAYSYLTSKGFPVISFTIGHNQDLIRTVYHSALAAKKEGLLGMYSYNGSTSRYYLSSPVFNAILPAIYAWAVPISIDPPFSYEEVYQNFYEDPHVHPSIKSEVVTLDISRHCNNTLSDTEEGDGIGWFDYGPDQDASALTPGTLEYRKYRFLIIDPEKNNRKSCITVTGKDLKTKTPERVAGIAVGRKVRSLLFLHTSVVEGYYRLDWRDSQRTGSYTVHYADGSKENISLRMIINIGPWFMDNLNCRQGWRTAFQGYYNESRMAYLGYTAMGERVNLQAMEWLNPHPGKEIVSIDLKAERGDARIALVALSYVK